MAIAVYSTVFFFCTAEVAVEIKLRQVERYWKGHSRHFFQPFFVHSEARTQRRDATAVLRRLLSFGRPAPAPIRRSARTSQTRNRPTGKRADSHAEGNTSPAFTFATTLTLEASKSYSFRKYANDAVTVPIETPVKAPERQRTFAFLVHHREHQTGSAPPGAPCEIYAEAHFYFPCAPPGAPDRQCALGEHHAKFSRKRTFAFLVLSIFTSCAGESPAVPRKLLTLS